MSATLLTRTNGSTLTYVKNVSKPLSVFEMLPVFSTNQKRSQLCVEEYQQRIIQFYKYWTPKRHGISVIIT